MKKVYRDHEITVVKEKSLGGWTNTYFTIVRLSDGLILEDGFTTGDDGVREVVKYMCGHVDDSIENGNRD